MTTAAEIAERIMIVWASDQAIQEYCQNVFNKVPLIQNAIDENSPPGDDDFPLICFYDWKSSGGMTGSHETFEFLVGIAVVERAVTFNDTLNTKIYSGPARVETLRSLAERAIRSARIGKVTWNGGEGPLTDFPVFTAMSVITVETPNIRLRQ